MQTAEQQIVAAALTEASRVARRAVAEARAGKAKLAEKAAEAESRRRQALEQAADARAWRRIAEAVLWIPVARGRLVAGLAMREQDATRESEVSARSSAAAKSGCAAVAKFERRAGEALDRLRKAASAIGELGTPPRPILVSAEGILSRARYLMRADRPKTWIDDAVALAEAAVALVRDWARARAAYDARRKAETARAAASGKSPRSRIYLPIPPALGRKAEALGASRDPSSPRGASPWFVEIGQDLGPFRSMLPLAYRPDPPKFEFPPVPYSAAGQNLWTLFDDWGHIRSSAYAMSGRRCAICGRRGGFLSEKVFGEEGPGSPIECHEVWDWSVPDPSAGVGVQTLSRLLVVCPDCHFMFHEGFARRAARNQGMEDEVAAFIEKRRMAVTRSTQAELARSLEGARGKLTAVAGVDKWVLDLGHLAKQQYMLDVVPTMREHNRAQLAPERVAGLAFETDGGRTFAARDAAEIVAELSAPDLDRAEVSAWLGPVR